MLAAWSAWASCKHAGGAGEGDKATSHALLGLYRACNKPLTPGLVWIIKDPELACSPREPRSPGTESGVAGGETVSGGPHPCRQQGSSPQTGAECPVPAPESQHCAKACNFS